MNKISILALLFSTPLWSGTYDVLKEEVGKKGTSGNPAFVGDFVVVNSAVTKASIFKIPGCADKDCSFDFSTNIKALGKDELFTCSPPVGVKINFANNDKGYIFIETPNAEGKKPSKCSLRLEMKTSELLVVSNISCPQDKIGDCDRDDFLGEFKRLGRPSFDCGVLTPYLELTPARRTICHNIDLSHIDHDLDAEYDKVQGKDYGHKLNTAFMRSREACGANESCLKSLYVKWKEQIKELAKTKDD